MPETRTTGMHECIISYVYSKNVYSMFDEAINLEERIKKTYLK